MEENLNLEEKLCYLNIFSIYFSERHFPHDKIFDLIFWSLLNSYAPLAIIFIKWNLLSGSIQSVADKEKGAHAHTLIW